MGVWNLAGAIYFFKSLRTLVVSMDLWTAKLHWMSFCTSFHFEMCFWIPSDIRFQGWRPFSKEEKAHSWVIWAPLSILHTFSSLPSLLLNYSALFWFISFAFFKSLSWKLSAQYNHNDWRRLCNDQGDWGISRCSGGIWALAYQVVE